MRPSFRKLPPLNALAAFEAVARHRSFTKAAAELFLTHSAVSQRVTQLEKQLEVKLLARSRRGVELTPAGARYLESVSDALSTLALASDRFSKTAPRQLRLGVLPVFASNWLIYRLRSFHRLHPNIDLDIQSSTALANVKTGEVDIAIRWGKGDWPGVEKVKLFPGELIPVCSKLYRKEIGAPRSPADLRRPVLLRHSFQPWKPWLEKAGLDWPEPTQGPLFNDSSLMLQAAADGHGIALGRQDADRGPAGAGTAGEAFRHQRVHRGRVLRRVHEGVPPEAGGRRFRRLDQVRCRRRRRGARSPLIDPVSESDKSCKTISCSSS